MKILGIDPGLNFTGWGVVEASNSSLKVIDCGIINPSNKLSISERLFVIYTGLNDTIKYYSPQVVSIEETFVNQNPLGALKLGYARGIALMVPAIYGLSVAEYAPNTIKKTVAGNGHASKEQIKTMVHFLVPSIKSLDKEVKIKDDAIDAIAIAICYAYHNKF